MLSLSPCLLWYSVLGVTISRLLTKLLDEAPGAADLPGSRAFGCEFFFTGRADGSWSPLVQKTTTKQVVSCYGMRGVFSGN